MPTREHVAEAVRSYAQRNRLPAEQIPAVVVTVHAVLAALERGTLPELTKQLVPAVPIKRAVQAESVTCLDCGFKSKMIRRHLTAAHGMTVNEYRARWGLSSDYPMVARNYLAHRSELAKAISLSEQGKATRIIERAPAPTNVVERAVARLASETKLRGILTQS
jgi:predicted transcriptional regulator